MRAHAGVKGPTGQQSTKYSTYPAPQVVPQEWERPQPHTMCSPTGRTRQMCSRRPCRLGVVVLRRSDTPLRAGGALPAGRFLHPIGCGKLPCKLRKLFPEKGHRLRANWNYCVLFAADLAVSRSSAWMSERCIPQTLPRSVLELSGMS